MEAKSRLVVLTKGLSDSVARDNSITPTLGSLRRKLTEGKEAWQSYDAAHFALVALLTQSPAALKLERDAYQEQFQLVDIAQDQVEELIERRLAAEKLAAAPPVADLESEYSIAKNQRLATYKLQESKVKKVEDHFKPPTDGAVARKESIKCLEILSKLLDEADVLIKDGSFYTGLMIKHKPALNEADIATDAEQVASIGGRVADQRDLIAGLQDSIAPAAPTVAAPENADRQARGGRDSYMYQRRPKPSFDGQKRNYPSFRREWLAGVTGKFDADYEVREIKYNVPAEVEPDLKNLLSMKSIWAVLDAKYGKTMDLSMELVTGLQRFSFTRGADTETSKFQELYREWVKVYCDLEQVKELMALDHKPTLCNIAKMLPSEASKMRYAVMRIKRQKENEEAEKRHADAEGTPAGLMSELEIMNEFMRAEHELQETFEHLLSPESAAKAKPSGPLAGGRTTVCFKCGKSGHQKNQCTEGWPKPGSSAAGRAAHASTKEPPAPCPACNQHHPFTPFDPAAPKYKSRLYVCQTFRGMSVSERASLIERVGGYALCLDWTGQHTRDNCTSKAQGGDFPMCDKVDGGIVCGRPHNYLLHGTASKFSCCVRMMRDEVAISHSSRLEQAEVVKKDAKADDPSDKLANSSAEVEESKLSSGERANEECCAAAKDESLRELLGSTEAKIDDILSGLSALEDVKKTNVEFWTVLCRLRLAQDEQESSGKKEEELGNLSIKKFKRMAMTKFANSVEQLNSKVPSPEGRPPDLKADEVVEECLIRPEEEQSEGVANIVEEKSKVEMEKSYKKAEVQIRATKAEAADTTLPRLKKVEGSSKIQFDKRGPEEEKQEANVIMIDKEVEKSFGEAKVKLIHTAKAEAVEWRKLKMKKEEVSPEKTKVVKFHPPDEGLVRKKEDNFKPCSSSGTDAQMLAPLDAGD